MRNRSRLTGPPTGRGNEAPLHSPDWFRKAEWELGLRAAVSARVRRRTVVRITNRYHSIAIGSNGYHCLAMAPQSGHVSNFRGVNPVEVRRDSIRPLSAHSSER